MDQRLHSDIVSRLERDYGFEAKKDWLRKGKCPSCGKKEMFTSAEHPWVLRCPRTNHCGVEFHVKEIYADLFASWSDRYKPTPEVPNASADAYLRSGRGFDLTKITGCYTQENYYDSEKKIGSATVRFPLTGTVWWERIIDKPERFDRKANFRGAFGGMWWMPPSLTEIPKELWIVEGIFDAIALLHHNIHAASAMSSVNYPATALKALVERCQAEGKPRPKLVWAFDGGRAGRKATRQFAKRSRDEGWEASAAMIPMEGKREPDWNDMHQRGRLEKHNLVEYRHHGDLLLAASASAKALLIYRHNSSRSSFPFEFDNRLQWFKLDLDRFNKEMQALEKDEESKRLSKDEVREQALLKSYSVAEIANCHPTALYFQENKLTDEQWYYFRIDFPSDLAPVKRAFTPAQVTSSSEFKKRMASAPGACYTGTAGQLDALFKRWSTGIKVVDTIDFIGYSADHGAWVFTDVAVKDGKQIQINDEDFFDVGRLSIKSLSLSPALHINKDPAEFSTEWLGLLWECYYQRGIVALAFWLGALFVQQIRAKQSSFPFIELVGEPGAGKSTLIEFMWRLVGRKSYEGFDPVKSTVAARARNFIQVANLPVVLMEGDRKGDEDRVKQKGFDWDELKPLYDGRSVYSRGVKNGGNDTYEPPFRGALVISQNATVCASPAMLERICHVHFDKAQHTDETKAAADQLTQLDIEQLSGFVLAATKAEKAVLATFFERMPVHEQRLLKMPCIRTRRIAKTHAQLSALVDALAQVLPLTKSQREETHAFIEDMAAERQETINADHQLVTEFWETYEFLNGDVTLNHSRSGGEIAINLNHFVKVATEARQQLPDMSELKKLLKTSRDRKFAAYKPVNSRIYEEYNATKSHPSAPDKALTAKCWVFKPAD